MDASQNKFADEASLQFLGNRQQYKKYISANDEIKSREIKIFQDNLDYFKDEIILITKNYCENPDIQLSSELDEIFEAYAKRCIKHLEMKELESKDSSDEDDMLFGKINDNKPTESVHSFWGKNVRKK